MIDRWTRLLLWTSVACLFAGIYGAIHNQVSYTVSPEYFHRFKFVQFRVHDFWQNRWGAAIVGWRAAWWTGLLFGPPMVIVALRRCAADHLTRVMSGAFAVAVVVDAICGLDVLCLAAMTIRESMLDEIRMPDGVQSRVAFACAGLMHDASYAGGLLATIAGCLTIIKMTPRQISPSI